MEATHRLIEAVVDADSRMRRRLDFVSEAIFEVDGLAPPCMSTGHGQP